VTPRIQYKPSRTHRTRAYIKKRMAAADQENIELKKEVGNLKEGMEKIIAMMVTMMAAQAQASQAQVAQAQVAIPQPDALLLPSPFLLLFLLLLLHLLVPHNQLLLSLLHVLVLRSLS
jgi:uncharacterized membrane protein YgcG